ncbi:hypothetical protein ACFUYE_01690 [Micromonospora humida]|uniref:hypothetical protein n=1 Tax=Micromonospora humida TaxID=2809018 RepID=UPI00366F20F6
MAPGGVELDLDAVLAELGEEAGQSTAASGRVGDLHPVPLTEAEAFVVPRRIEADRAGVDVRQRRDHRAVLPDQT